MTFRPRIARTLRDLGAWLTKCAYRIDPTLPKIGRPTGSRNKPKMAKTPLLDPASTEGGLQ